ncbi:MAG: VOC family protein [Thaumarchaeota archaeon]|nr:VOC family protein [Nitrososphaerota archaeon]
MKFIYTGIHVADLERAIRFYTAELGMQLLFKTEIKETGGKVAWLKTKGSSQILELNWYPEGYAQGGSSGLDHLAFQVDDLNRTYAGLTKRQRGAMAPFEEGSWRLAYIKDPDGNWIELGEKMRPAKTRKNARST